MAGRLAFSVDLDRCIGCSACVVACRAGNEVPPGEAFIAVTDVVRRQAGGLWGSFSHRRCFHCAEAACIGVCPTGALSKWSGLTAVEAERCSGCGYCTDACPFQVPRVRDDRVMKCVGCVSLLQDGQAPWCERTCPSQAIRFGEREALLADAQARVAALRERYPNARVYGETQLGGLGLLLILLEEALVYGLPEAPRAPLVLEAWRAVRPAATGLSATAAAAMGLMFVVARRQRLREQEKEEAVPEPPPPGGESGPDEPPVAADPTTPPARSQP